MLAVVVMVLAGCFAPAHLTETAGPQLLLLPPFTNAHTGISIYDADASKYLYNYQGDKFFVPASNTKLFSLYAGLKYLKDSLAGIRYEETADSFFIYPTADPSLLHPDFLYQPVIAKLQRTSKPVALINNNWKEEALGLGWSWDDYNDDYMAERSALPVYGNTIKWTQASQKNTQPNVEDSVQTFIYSDPEVNWKVRFKEDTAKKGFVVTRKKDENIFEVHQGKEPFKEQVVPFVTNGVLSAVELLKDTTGKTITVQNRARSGRLGTIYSQPADSLFKRMMYTSDNFFAEQTLLMASNEKLGVMNDARMIATLLQTDLKDLPQQPAWIDGSGLSRYNLFTPQDFVWILNRMRTEFGLQKLKALLPGGGQGTLKGYYLKDSAAIFAKTGTLTGVVALSGFLVTKKNKLLIFSVLVNNHHGSATAVRRGVEQFIMQVRNRY